jgi:GNAT superfamily N-acetyltransferase
MTTAGGVDLRPFAPALTPAVVSVWNAAAGDRFPLRERLFRQNTVDDPHFDPAGCAVAVDVRTEAVIGFAVAKVARVPLGTDGLRPDRGWISMLAVAPPYQRRGIGTRLLDAAEAFLRGRGRRRFVLGSDPAHFFPGVPDDPGALRFFGARGYALRGDAFDLRRPLDSYQTPPAVLHALAANPGIDVRPLRRGEEAPLLAFLDAAFPGRWRYTVARFLDTGGAVGNIMGIVAGAEVLGFAHLFPPDASWIGPSVAWATPPDDVEAAPARAGGLGPMGISPAIRGRGLGLALLDRSVLHLRDAGATEAYIDWTVLLDFYGRLGFIPHRRYHHGERCLAD